MSARAVDARSAVTAAMDALGVRGEVELHRDNGNVVFWIGDHLVAKASIGAARTELEREAVLLDSMRPYALAVARVMEGQRHPFSVDDWSVLFTERLRALPGTVELPDVLGSLKELHCGLQSAILNVELPDWTGIVQGAKACRRENPFTGADSALMDKVYDLVVQPAMERPHAGHVLHGDVDLNQAIATADGIVWIDFETACRGPVEWDLAAFSDVLAYGECDLQLWQDLRLVHSWCVASWCNRADVESPSRRDARQHYLEALAATFR